MTNESSLEHAGATARVNISTPVADAGVTEVHELVDAENLQRKLGPPQNLKPSEASWAEQELQELEQLKIRKELEDAA